jgi:predicted deacylase
VRIAVVDDEIVGDLHRHTPSAQPLSITLSRWCQENFAAIARAASALAAVIARANCAVLAGSA